MKLNIDCIRDVLLYLEENITMDSNNRIVPISIKTIKLFLQEKYEENDIIYSIGKLNDCGYITAHVDKTNAKYKISGVVTDITWEGHELLNSIRPQTIWEVTKENATKLGVTSIRGVASLAKSVINAIVTNPDVISNIVVTIK